MIPTEKQELKNDAVEQPGASTVLASNDVIIRPFEKRDLPRCQEILKSNYDFSHVLDLAASHILVAEAGGQAIGFGYVHIWQWNKVAWLDDVIVDQAFRGRGVGRKLVFAFAEVAKKEGCLILMDHPPASHPAIGFYLKIGFRICGYNDSYFSDPKQRMAVFVCLDL